MTEEVSPAAPPPAAEAPQAPAPPHAIPAQPAGEQARTETSGPLVVYVDGDLVCNTTVYVPKQPKAASEHDFAKTRDYHRTHTSIGGAALVSRSWQVMSFHLNSGALPLNLDSFELDEANENRVAVVRRKAGTTDDDLSAYVVAPLQAHIPMNAATKLALAHREIVGRTDGEQPGTAHPTRRYCNALTRPSTQPNESCLWHSTFEIVEATNSSSPHPQGVSPIGIGVTQRTSPLEWSVNSPDRREKRRFRVKEQTSLEFRHGGEFRVAKQRSAKRSNPTTPTSTADLRDYLRLQRPCLAPPRDPVRELQTPLNPDEPADQSLAELVRSSFRFLTPKSPTGSGNPLPVRDEFEYAGATPEICILNDYNFTEEDTRAVEAKSRDNSMMLNIRHDSTRWPKWLRLSEGSGDAQSGGAASGDDRAAGTCAGAENTRPEVLISECPELIIYQCNEPVATDSPLLSCLHRAVLVDGNGNAAGFVRDRTIVITTGRALRQSEVLVSTGLSWERLAQDATWAIFHNYRTQRLKDFAHVIVFFNFAGAVVMSRRPAPTAPATGHGQGQDGSIAHSPEPEDSKTHETSLVFPPDEMEEDFERKNPHGVFGRISSATYTISLWYAMWKRTRSMHPGIVFPLNGSSAAVQLEKAHTQLVGGAAAALLTMRDVHLIGLEDYQSPLFDYEFYEWPYRYAALRGYMNLVQYFKLREHQKLNDILQVPNGLVHHLAACSIKHGSETWTVLGENYRNSPRIRDTEAKLNQVRAAVEQTCGNLRQFSNMLVEIDGELEKVLARKVDRSIIDRLDVTLRRIPSKSTGMNTKAVDEGAPDYELSAELKTILRDLDSDCMLSIQTYYGLIEPIVRAFQAPVDQRARTLVGDVIVDLSSMKNLVSSAKKVAEASIQQLTGILEGDAGFSSETDSAPASKPGDMGALLTEIKEKVERVDKLNDCVGSIRVLDHLHGLRAGVKQPVADGSKDSRLLKAIAEVEDCLSWIQANMPLLQDRLGLLKSKVIEAREFHRTLLQSRQCDPVELSARYERSQRAYRTLPRKALELAEKIARQGWKASPELRRVPIGHFDELVLLDRFEIEAMRNIQRLVREYASSREERPLGLAVFGPPGTGKSFAVKAIIRSLRDEKGNIQGQKTEELVFNLSQFQREEQLYQSMQQITAASMKDRLSVVIWDEFDTFRGEPLFWLKHFLAPLQDGEYFMDGMSHPLGKSIHFFAGGTNHTYEQLTERDPNGVHKVPDFLSRLKGYLNIVGINPEKRGGKSDGESSSDRKLSISDQDNILIRRAVLLHSLLKRHYGHSVFQGERLDIDDSLLRAFLLAPDFRHGARSMEAIALMSVLSNWRKYSRSSLPSRQQLNLHTDGDEFMRIINQEEMQFALKSMSKSLRDHPIKNGDLSTCTDDVLRQILQAVGISRGQTDIDELTTLLRKFEEEVVTVEGIRDAIGNKGDIASIRIEMESAKYPSIRSSTSPPLVKRNVKSAILAYLQERDVVVGQNKSTTKPDSGRDSSRDGMEGVPSAEEPPPVQVRFIWECFNSLGIRFIAKDREPERKDPAPEPDTYVLVSSAGGELGLKKLDKSAERKRTPSEEPKSRG